jgi:hypothetical protein
VNNSERGCGWGARIRTWEWRNQNPGDDIDRIKHFSRLRRKVTMNRQYVTDGIPTVDNRPRESAGGNMLPREQPAEARPARPATPPKGSVGNSGVRDGKKKPPKGRDAGAVADFLQRALVGGATDVTQLEAMARVAGLLGKQQIQHTKAFKKAKKSLGIRSIRDGFGSKGKWAWFLPGKPLKPAKKEVDCTKDGNSREQTRSVSVNLNGLPAELLSGRISPHWVDGIARLEGHQVPREVSALRWRQFINDCHTFLLAKENWAECAAGHGWNDLELFGCCRRPLAHLGNAGLLWAINGGRLVELRRDWAVIERASDRSRHVHQRERPKAADITLPWVGLRVCPGTSSWIA